MRIDRGNIVCLPTEVAETLKRNVIRKDDILITRTGANRGDCALFDSDELAVASSHTFIVRSAGWKHPYLMAFLNSFYGKAQIDKGAYGAAQPELASYYLQRIWVPAASEKLQARVSDIIERARAAAGTSSATLAEAESILLDALGLRGWSPPEPLTYTRSAAAVAEAGRLDSQYFMPAKTEMLEALARLPGAPLGDSFASIRDMIDPNKGDPDTVVRNYDLTHALQPVLDATTLPSRFAEIDSQKKRMKDGDLAVSRLRSYLREIAVVRVTDGVPAVGSSEFLVLRAQSAKVGVSADALMVFLKSPPVQTVLKWCQDGSQHPRFAERDLLAIPLPDVVRGTMRRSPPKSPRRSIDGPARSRCSKPPSAPLRSPSRTAKPRRWRSSPSGVSALARAALTRPPTPAPAPPPTPGARRSRHRCRAG